MFFLALCLSYRPIPTLFIKEFVNMGKFECISFALEQSCIHSQMQCWGLRGSLRLKLFLMRFSLVQLLRCLFLPVLSCTLSGPHVWRTNQHVLPLVEKPWDFSPFALATFSHHSSMHLPFLSFSASCSQCSFFHNSPGHLCPVLYQSARCAVTLLATAKRTKESNKPNEVQ